MAEEKVTPEQQSEDTKKKKDNKPKVAEEKAPKKKKKGKGILIVFLFFLLLIGLFVATIFFNPFNIREKYLRGPIEKIPIIKNILPATTGTTDTPVVTTQELEAKIADLEKQIESQKNTVTVLTDNNNALDLENKRLREIESQQLEFKKTKEEFDKLIATKDPAAYSKFYEQISPENAATLYTATKESAEQQKEIKKYTDTFSTIDPAAGAKIIEEMIGTDMNLASLILKNTDSKQRAEIIAAMDSVKAASVVKYMAPNTTGQ